MHTSTVCSICLGFEANAIRSVPAHTRTYSWLPGIELESWARAPPVQLKQPAFSQSPLLYELAAGSHVLYLELNGSNSFSASVGLRWLN